MTKSIGSRRLGQDLTEHDDDVDHSVAVHHLCFQTEILKTE